MKFILLFLVFPFFIYSQTQVGDDVEGSLFGQSFGNSVALSANGNIVAIGGNTSSNTVNFSGKVKVFEYVLSNWIQKGQEINGVNESDRFGSSVSISSNGNILAVSAPRYISGSDTILSYCKVYSFISNQWVQLGNTIYADNYEDLFGASISFSGNGNILAIGAPSNNNNTGYVKVYQLDSGFWKQKGQSIHGIDVNYSTGNSVSLSTDGSILAVGSPADGNKSGYVKIYNFDTNQWNQMGNTITNSEINNLFGYSVDLSDNGNRIVIGAIQNDVSGTYLSGYIEIYDYISEEWIESGNRINGEGQYDGLGCSVSISGNGTIVSAGAPNIQGNSSEGYTSIYQNISNNWVQVGNKIFGENFDDFSGSSVSLSNNGIIAVGSPNNNGGKGQVRMYDFNSNLGNNVISNENISIYPNPVKDLLTVKLTEYYPSEEITITDVTRKIILIQKTEGLVTTINTCSLQKGVYLLTLKNGKTQSTQQFIVE